MRPYCKFNHGSMLKTRGKFSKRDGGERQYYHCRNFSCGYTELAPRDDDKFFKERFPENWAVAEEHMKVMKASPNWVKGWGCVKNPIGRLEAEERFRDEYVPGIGVYMSDGVYCCLGSWVIMHGFTPMWEGGKP